MKVPKNLESDFPFTIQTRQSDRTRLRKKYNPYADDFVVDLEEIIVSQDIDIIDDRDEEWIDYRSKPEVEIDDEQQKSY